MCKNEFFESSGTKNKLFKVQRQKPNFMQSLGTKTIVYPIFFYDKEPQQRGRSSQLRNKLQLYNYICHNHKKLLMKIESKAPFVSL